MKNYADVIKAYEEVRYWQYEVRKVSGSIASYRSFDLSYSGGLPLPNYYATLYNSNTSQVIYRFGISSTSKGIILGAGCSIKVDDVVYFKEGTTKKKYCYFICVRIKNGTAKSIQRRLIY